LKGCKVTLTFINCIICLIYQVSTFQLYNIPTLQQK
jgi:hypothetical protein